MFLAVLLDGGLVAGDGGDDGPVQLPAQHPLVVTTGHHQVPVLTELHGVHAAVVGQQVLKEK